MFLPVKILQQWVLPTVFARLLQLYLTLHLFSNVKIVERHQHSQRVSYVPLGRDAAISGNVQNFRWKNNTKYAIKIKMTVKGGKITCTFYTCQKAKPKKVKLKVTQKGKTFALKDPSRQNKLLLQIKILIFKNHLIGGSFM